jgi:hypothetical protein
MNSIEDNSSADSMGSEMESEIEDLAVVRFTGELVDLKDHCPFCSEVVNKHDPSTWKAVTGWVGGPKKDSMRLRKDTGYYAHDRCVQRLQSGQAADQPDLFSPVTIGIPSLETEDFEWVIDCPFNPPHEHVFPSDWFFGGANGDDFRADSRWTPTSYCYISDRLELLHVTVAPGCDNEAIDFFTQVYQWFKPAKPKWIRVRRNDGTSETLSVIYDADTDEVFET